MKRATSLNGNDLSNLRETESIFESRLRGGSMLPSKTCVSFTNSSSVGTEISRRVARLSITAVIVAVIVAALALLSFAPKAAADEAAGKQLFQSNCVVCHGADGTGTPTGKSLKAPDLNSDQVQKMTDAQIADQIANGKNNMPPFKNTLSKDQISSLVAYVKTFGKKK
jgi:cbb3-type cytochrome c oxidase subunit III